MCEEIMEVGTLELVKNPHRPEYLVDIFWSDPEAITSEWNWRGIAETLVGRYACGDGVTMRNMRQALAAAGDKCATERAVVAQQLHVGAIKQGVEGSWTPTRKLWRCGQRLARRAAAEPAPAEPTSEPTERQKYEDCIAGGWSPAVCEAEVDVRASERKEEAARERKAGKAVERKAGKTPRARPVSRREQCLIDGYPPSVCNAGDLFGR